MNEANNLMPKLLEIGMLNGHSLLMLKDMLNHVCNRQGIHTLLETKSSNLMNKLDRIFMFMTHVEYALFFASGPLKLTAFCS